VLVAMGDKVFDFDFSGKLRAQAAVEKDESAYLYAQGFSSGGHQLSVITDDGRIAVYSNQTRK
jgi:hypothetical protein